MLNKFKYIYVIAKRECNYYRNLLLLQKANIEITNFCNLHCIMCKLGREKSFSQNELTLQEWKELLDSLLQLGVRWINFIGAEPLVRKDDVIEMASYLSRRGVYQKLSTNGTLIDLHLAVRIVELFDEIAISLDAPNEKHDKIRGQDSIFKLACEGIRMIEEARNMKKLKSPTINIHTTIFNANYDMIEEMVDKAEELGVDIISLQFVSQNSSESFFNTKYNGKIIASDRYIVEPNSLLLDEKQLFVLKQQLHRIQIKARRIKVIVKPLSNFSNDVFLKGEFPIHRCYITRDRVIISPQGEVNVCSHLSYSLGNIRDDPLDKIWGNSRHLQLVNSLKKELFPICIACCHFSANFTPFQYCRLNFYLPLK